MHGKCLCGQIHFEIDVSDLKLYQCHCSLCRRQSGSSSNSATIVDKEHFTWLTGQEHISSWVKESGFRSDFCSKCGSPVPNPLGTTNYYWIPAGLLVGKVEAEIVAHLFVGAKASWDVIASTGTQHETLPELADLINCLHSGTTTT